MKLGFVSGFLSADMAQSRVGRFPIERHGQNSRSCLE